jgi:nucleoside-diphosphate-sugar epimerase
MAITILRPPIVYGPRDKDFFEAFKMASRGVSLSPGLIGNKRYSMIHVDDLGRALALALDKGRTVVPDSRGADGLYYVSDGGVYTWDDLLLRVARSLGKNTVVVPVPTSLSWGAGLVGELAGILTGKPQIVSIDKIREVAVDGWACSTERARRELGYEPAFPLDAGLADAARWYRENRWI